MTKQEVIDIMKERGYTFSMESRNGKGEIIGLYFLSEPVLSKRRNDDKVLIPSYNCTVYPNSDEFQMTYAVSKSINTLQSPKCGSFTNEDHFNRIGAKFESAVEVLYRAFGD